MDIEKFKKLVTDRGRTKDELQTMLNHALRAGESEFARIAKQELDSRYPGWSSVRTRKGGKTPTFAIFREAKRRFETAKEAYIWLIEKFIEAHPEPFSNVNWQTIFVAKGVRRNYFGRDLRKMFHGSPHLADDSNNYRKLPNGWYANLNLGNAQKFDILCRFAAVGDFAWRREWSWKIEGQSSSDDDSLDSLFESLLGKEE